MAAALTPAQAELISSLSQEEIPIKLRCAICSRLAVNAFRLPCCEQAICESCQSSLPSSCPVCEHTPVAAEDCKPNKSLRTTIKVFLRTEEKKREDRRLKDIKNSPTVTQETPTAPAEPVKNPTIPLELAPAPSEFKDEEPTIELPVLNKQHKGVSENNVAGEEPSLEDQKDIPQPSIEEIAPGQEQTEDSNTNANRRGGNDVEAVNYQSGQIEMIEKDSNGQSIMMPGMQSLAFGAGLGFDSTGTGGFPNMAAMGQGGDFNQMQMMMAMQNSMMPNAFGAFPMMGMPGMTMDPMAMQSMYMNGGFGAQGIGMNGMNMGMGMAGFDGGVGAGFNNGWNGQQSWNVGQDNFNHPNAAGMSHGDFGANNSTFQPSAGYNQGNYGRANQYNDYQQSGYSHQNQGQYFRGRGRGRGYGYGAGRGGHGYGYNEAFSQQLPHGLQNGPSVGLMSDTSIPTGPKADSVSSAPAATSNVDEFGREIREKSKVLDESTEPKAAPANDVVAIESTEEQTSSKENEYKELSTNVQDDEPKPIQTIDQLESSNVAQINAIPTAPTGPSGRGGFHGNFNDRSVSRSMGPPHIPALTPKPLDIPINAPTGPKAMREGLPNTSLVNLRARGGYPTVGRGSIRLNGSHIESPLAPVTSRSQSPEKEKETVETRDRGHTRSPSVDRERDKDRRSEKHKRRHRHRSTSESEDETDRDRRSEKHRRRHRHRSASRSDDEERRRDRRRKRERKHGDDANENDKDEALSAESRTNGEDVERSRSQSPAESRRSSHRSRRDRERERDRDRDKDRERDKERSHRSSHRSHRERSRDRSRDRDRERSPDRDRDRRRRRHDSVEARDKDKDTSAESQHSAPVEEKKQEVKIPSGPRAMSMTNGTNGIEIKGASGRGQSVHGVEDKKSSRTASHTEERKSKDRDREREREREKERDAERSRDHRRDSRANGHESSVTSVNAKPAIDPHTLEREARNRERLLKEAQRMAGLAASAAGGGRKRSRDEGALGGGDDGRKGRKHRRSDREADEERIARLENERESSRWA